MDTAPQTPHHLMRMDSPMSDYFTDPSNSPDLFRDSPSSTQQDILRRLHSLSDWVLRQDLASHTATKAHLTLDELEGVLIAPNPQSRQPADIDESDLFSPEEEVEAHDFGLNVECNGEEPNNPLYQAHRQDDVAIRHEGTTSSNKKLLEESQKVLSRISAATQKLQMRYQEVRDSNALAQEAIERSSCEIMRLRSDNASLCSDISSDHSDLLYLKLRLDNLEAHVTSHINDDYYCRDSQELTDGIDRWKSEWDCVDAKLRCRRLQRRGDSQKRSISGNTFNDDICVSDARLKRRINNKCDAPMESYSLPKLALEGEADQGAQVKDKGVCTECWSTRDNTPPFGTALSHGRSQNNNSMENEQARTNASAKPVSSMPLELQSCDSKRQAKPGSWAKLLDELAELAGIYDY